MKTSGMCYSGVKHSLFSAGVIDKLSDMPYGSATKSVEYFQKRTDMFEELKVKKDEIEDLPAGTIIVWSKEGYDGHIAISSGNGQFYSDCIDDGSWNSVRGGSYNVFKLRDDKFSVNGETGKISYNK